MTAEPSSKIRTTIVKVPDSTPGMVFVNGQQKQFTMEGIWRSPVAPAANMTVEVELDAAGNIASMSVVDAQTLNKEKMDQLSAMAQERGKEAAKIAQQGIGTLAARMGKIALGAAVVLWIAWFFLPAASVNLGFLGAKSYTFWDFLGVDLSDLTSIATVNHGFFAIIGILAIAVPFVAPFWKDPRAKFLNVAPLVFVVLAVGKFYWSITHMMGSTGGPDGGQFASEMASSMMKTVTDAISIGLGAYLLIIAALVLAAQALKKSVVTA